MITPDPSSTDGSLRLCDVCGDDAKAFFKPMTGRSIRIFLTDFDSDSVDLCSECDDAIRTAIEGRRRL